MTLNLLFLTITVKKRKLSREEVNHQETVAKRYEKMRDKQSSMYRM